MRHRSRTQLYGQWLKLVKKTNPKTGRKHYSVIASPYHYVMPGLIAKGDLDNLQHDLRAHFDPAGNRGQKAGYSWKFSNKQEAEQLITMALLKWGEHYVA